MKISKIILLFLFPFIIAPVFSQRNANINPVLREYINNPKNQSKTVHLWVKGNTEQIKCEINNYNGKFKYLFKNYAAVSIPVKSVSDFATSGFVQSIVFDIGKGQPLNNQVLINNNVLPVHQGLSPLIQAYDGSGIIIGIIDTGLDWKHPDFRTSNDNTRIISYWDQGMPDSVNSPQPYGYGQEFTGAEIDGGFTPNPPGDHGTHVTGTACSNGLAPGNMKGVAPAADIIMVESDFTKFNWTITVAEAVEYIFNIADSLGKPCVINASVGTLWGSHDGKDPAAQMIDSLLQAKNGRAFVCAAGNSGAAIAFHLGYDVTSDTSFTWFEYNANSGLGYGSVFFELWADTADFNNVQFAVGADRADSVYSFRGNTPFDNIQNRLNINVLDTLFNNGNEIAVVETWADIPINGIYRMQVHIKEPDSSQYYFRFMTTGSGKLDVWSSAGMTVSNIISDEIDSLPTIAEFPDIINYKPPDKNSTLVSSFNCSPNVITVGNYVNRINYVDVAGDTQVYPGPSGSLFITSSKGPTRDGRIKPDIAGPGTTVLSAVTLKTIGLDTINQPYNMSQDGYHKRNSGTSMASPGVAGIAALYFQKCPNANYQDVFSAITTSAKTDSLTGSTLPDNSWGYGKIDAFAALTLSPKPTISVPGDTSVCKDINISVNGNFSAYQWSPNGETTNNIDVTLQNNYYVIVTDSDGCKTSSDTITVAIDPYILPKPPITANGPVTFCEGDSVNLSVATGYSNYGWSPNGETINNIDISQTGFYSAEVTDADGCMGQSDTIMVSVLINPPQPSVSQNGNKLTSTIGNAYQWYLNSNIVTGDTAQTLTISDSGYYQVEVFHANGCSSISDSVYALPVGVDELGVGNWELEIFPNPNDGVFELRIQNSEFRIQNFEIEVYNVLGERINLKLETQNSKLKVDISNQPEGIYFLSIHGENFSTARKVIYR